MTRKDFELIAGVLSNIRKVTLTKEGKEDLNYIARDFADALQDAHPRFDKFRFLVACGVWKEEIIDGVRHLTTDTEATLLND
jgi:hypothetical protein